MPASKRPDHRCDMALRVAWKHKRLKVRFDGVSKQAEAPEARAQIAGYRSILKLWSKTAVKWGVESDPN